MIVLNIAALMLKNGYICWHRLDNVSSILSSSIDKRTVTREVILSPRLIRDGSMRRRIQDMRIIIHYTNQRAFTLHT